MRIVAFVGSPVEHDEKEAVKVAKRLKKEKVNVDIVSFGEDVSARQLCRLIILSFPSIVYMLHLNLYSFAGHERTRLSNVYKHDKRQRWFRQPFSDDSSRPSSF
jgi:hypothetical protein